MPEERSLCGSALWCAGGHVVDLQRQKSQFKAERPPGQMDIAEGVLSDPSFRHVNFDFSWDEVAKYAVASPQSIARVTALLNRYPDRILFGTDTVPATPSAYFSVFEMWTPVVRLLTPEAKLKVFKTNYERIFDDGRKRVREWEKANLR
jgi:hypothetical protein